MGVFIYFVKQLCLYWSLEVGVWEVELVVDTRVKAQNLVFC